jgi:uncharacterized membrane protein (DUF485 family)
MMNDPGTRRSLGPSFHELVRTRSSLAWGLSALMLGIYFAFILLVAFAPGVLAVPIAEGSVITVGIPVGLLVIVSAFVLTGVYVHRANTRFDELNRRAIEEMDR